MNPLLINPAIQVESVQAMPLASANIGERLNIVSLRTDRPGMEMLTAAGLVPGCRLTLHAKAGDSVVIEHADRKLAITGKLAGFIWVRLVADEWD